MTRYLIRRLGFAIFTLLLLSMVTFGLVKSTPTDTSLDREPPQGQSISYRQQIAQAKRTAELQRLDLPIFYFTLTTAARPDTLERIFSYERRDRLLQLLGQSGNWPAVQQYEEARLDAEEVLERDSSPQVGLLRLALHDVHQAKNLIAVDSLAKVAQEMSTRNQASPALQAELMTLTKVTHHLRTDLQPAKHWLPAVHWYGLDNQYHRWAKALLHGNLGQTTFSPRPVWDAIRFPLFTTLLTNVIAFFLAFRIAIPLGVSMARRGGRFDRVNRWVLLLLHSMPSFWLGGLLLVLFGSRHKGLHLIDGIDLPMYNLREGGPSFLLWAAQNADKFILPILTLTIYSLAMIALQMRGGIREVIAQDFIRTARAKGVPEDKVYQYHASRNALIPMITLFAGIFPSLFAGSIVIEYLFNFPGMGSKTYSAYQTQDFPLLFAILMLGALLTVVGNLIGDILYAWADPRVRFEKGG